MPLSRPVAPDLLPAGLLPPHCFDLEPTETRACPTPTCTEESDAKRLMRVAADYFDMPTSLPGAIGTVKAWCVEQGRLLWYGPIHAPACLQTGCQHSMPAPAGFMPSFSLPAPCSALPRALEPANPTLSAGCPIPPPESRPTARWWRACCTACCRRTSSTRGKTLRGSRRLWAGGCGAGAAVACVTCLGVHSAKTCGVQSKDGSSWPAGSPTACSETNSLPPTASSCPRSTSTTSCMSWPAQLWAPPCPSACSRPWSAHTWASEATAFVERRAWERAGYQLLQPPSAQGASWLMRWAAM